MEIFFMMMSISVIVFVSLLHHAKHRGRTVDPADPRFHDDRYYETGRPDEIRTTDEVRPSGSTRSKTPIATTTYDRTLTTHTSGSGALVVSERIAKISGPTAKYIIPCTLTVFVAYITKSLMLWSILMSFIVVGTGFSQYKEKFPSPPQLQYPREIKIETRLPAAATLNDLHQYFTNVPFSDRFGTAKPIEQIANPGNKIDYMCSRPAADEFMHSQGVIQMPTSTPQEVAKSLTYIKDYNDGCNVPLTDLTQAPIFTTPKWYDIPEYDEYQRTPTGEPTVGGPTGKPTVEDPTGEPTVGGPTGKPTVEDPTGKPTVGGPTGEPTVEDPTGKPSVGPSPENTRTPDNAPTEGAYAFKRTKAPDTEYGPFYPEYKYSNSSSRPTQQPTEDPAE